MFRSEKSKIIGQVVKASRKCGCCCCCCDFLRDSNKKVLSPYDSDCVNDTFIQPIMNQSACHASGFLAQSTKQSCNDPFIEKLLLGAMHQFASDDPITEMSEQIGRIQFGIKYKMPSQKLSLKILRATNVGLMNIGELCDPYVRVTLLPDTKNKLTTRWKHKDLNPVWNETLVFEDYPLEIIQESTLFLEVMDHDRFSKDDPIGEVEVPLMNFDLFVGQTIWKNLKPSEGRKGRLGELALSLCYDDPTLKITIGSAHNLKAKDIGGSSDPYVKIWLLTDGKKCQKKKTKTIWKNLNPEFNENFSFDVPVDKIRSSSLHISVMDHDRFKRNTLIGEIVIGSKTSPLEVLHWNEIFNKPRQEIFQRHILRILK